MKKHVDEILETPITPMIDVVFQLIIFFVVSAAQQQELLDETITLAKVTDVEAVKKTDRSTVTINVRKDGNINIGNVGMTQPQLVQILRTTRAQFGNEIPIVIRCDADADYLYVDKVVQAVGEAGLFRVKISAITSK